MSAYTKNVEHARMEAEAAGWVVAPGNRRGKSGLHRAACRLTAGGTVRFYGKCHRKYTALVLGQAFRLFQDRGKGEMVR